MSTRSFWSKKSFIPFATFVWWLFREYATDTLMESIRSFFERWGVTMWLWRIFLEHPAIITFVAFGVIIIWGYIDTKRELEKDIKVTPLTGKPASYEKNALTAWAELKVKNSSNVPLQDVSVQILELMQVYQDGQGIYHLHEPVPKWAPANVYWSGRTGASSQFSRPIHPNETQYATIAFHHELGGGIGRFNTINYPPMLESRIVIEISSPNSNTWRGIYYIEYHEPATDAFEFVEWDLWCKSH